MTAGFLLSLLPVILILVLMVGWRWNATSAGIAGYMCVLVVSRLFFGGTGQILFYAHGKALLLSLDVLLIIWAAFFLYRVVDESGAVVVIAEGLPYLTSDRGMQALIIGWIFASFLQGVGGFGVPVAVIAPILSSLGFSPLSAVVIPSLGHGWAVTFGSLGSSFQAMIASSGLSAAELGDEAAIFLGVAGVLSGFVVAHAADGWSGIRRLYLKIIIIGTSMGVGQYIAVHLGLWNIGALMGSLVGFVAIMIISQRSNTNKNATVKPDILRITNALFGYAILVIIILGIQLLPDLKQTLDRPTLSVQFPETRAISQFIPGYEYIVPEGPGRRIHPFGHTGALLAYAALISYGLYSLTGHYQFGAGRRIVNQTYKKVLPSSVGILFMVTMSVIMETSGMTDVLARGLASGAGVFFPVVTPLIGAIGAFITGSNTNSNVLFSGLQYKTAQILGLSPAFILAGQTAGAGLASILAPTKLVVGASTAGMAGKEGLVMAKLAAYMVLLILIISLLTIGAVYLF